MTPIEKLTESIRLATAIGGEVILATHAAQAVMHSAGLRVWDELAIATKSDMTYDPAIGKFRFTARPVPVPAPAPTVTAGLVAIQRRAAEMCCAHAAAANDQASAQFEEIHDQLGLMIALCAGNEARS